MLKKAILLFALSSLSLATSACNTVRGVGSDLQSAANSVDKAI